MTFTAKRPHRCILPSDLYTPPPADVACASGPARPPHASTPHNAGTPHANSHDDTQSVGWGANSGPLSFSAITRIPLAECREIFCNNDIQFQSRGYVNPSTMVDALVRAGVDHAHIGARNGGRGGGRGGPRYGLAFIQWGGPWEVGGSIAQQYRHTHWVGIARTDDDKAFIYDCIARDGNGAWVPRLTWEAHISHFVKQHIKGATGEWWIRSGIEVWP